MTNYSPKIDTSWQRGSEGGLEGGNPSFGRERGSEGGGPSEEGGRGPSEEGGRAGKEGREHELRSAPPSFPTSPTSLPPSFPPLPPPCSLPSSLPPLPPPLPLYLPHSLPPSPPSPFSLPSLDFANFALIRWSRKGVILRRTNYGLDHCRA